MKKTIGIILCTLLLFTSIVMAEYIPFGTNRALSTSQTDYDYENQNEQFQIYFNDVPNAGDTVEFGVNGVYITLQPHSFNYRNDLNQLQQINMPQGVNAVLSNENSKITYPNAYGSGIDLVYDVEVDRVKESLDVSAFTDLPTIEQYMIDGGNPEIEINFVMITNVQHIVIDGTDWDKSTDRVTTNEVLIKDDFGNILYRLEKPYVFDSNGNMVSGSYFFKKSANKLYVSIRIPYSFLIAPSTVYPIHIDPTFGIEYSVSLGNHLINGTNNIDSSSAYNSVVNITGGLSDNNTLTTYQTREYLLQGYEGIYRLAWKFGETNGSTTFDWSGNGNPGTIIGDGYDMNVTGYNVSGSGIELSSNGTVFLNTTGSSLQANQDDLFCVAFNASDADYGTLYRLTDNLEVDLLHMELLTNGRVKVTDSYGTSPGILTTTGTFDDDLWHTACAFLNSSEDIVYLYVDGIEEDSASIGTQLSQLLGLLYLGPPTAASTIHYDDHCIWKGTGGVPIPNVVELIQNVSLYGCRAVVYNTSYGMSIEGQWAEEYNSSWYWFLKLYKQVAGTVDLYVYAYDDSDNISGQYVMTTETGVGWKNINVSPLMDYMTNNVSLGYTKLRFWTYDTSYISDVYLRKEVDDNTPPVVTNCNYVDNTIDCDGTAKWNCTVTDFLDVASVTFTINGTNYSAVQNGDEWYYEMVFVDNPPISVNENFTLTNVYATDIVGNNQTNSSLNYTINHLCDKNFFTLMETPVDDFIMLSTDTFLMKCNVSIGSISKPNSYLSVRHTNGTLLPTGSGLLNVNESATYSCGTIPGFGSCNHTWEVTGGEFVNDANIECYAVSNLSSDSSPSIRVDVVGVLTTDLTMFLDDTSYISGTDSTAQMTTSFTSILYNMVWHNSTGGIVCNESGTTPVVADEIFFDSCTLTEGTASGMDAVFYLHGVQAINITDAYEIVAIGPNEYGIVELGIRYANAFLGRAQSIRGKVIDNESNLAIGESCRMQVDDAATGTPIFVSEELTIDGEGHCEYTWILHKDIFESPKSYSITLSAWQSSDEDLPAPQRSLGVASTTFNTQEYLTEVDLLLPVISTSHYAGFDKVSITQERVNNWGGPVEVIQDVWFADAISEQDYHYPELENIISTANVGTATITERYLIPEDLPSSIYRVEKNIYYYIQGDLKEVQFVISDTFNITSISDILDINSITIKDYFGEEVTIDTNLTISDVMPESNFSDPHIILAEGFGYQLCADVTNNYDSEIFWHMQHLIIHNPTTSQSFEEFHKDENSWQRLVTAGDSEICWYSTIPLTVETHSDWRFEFDIFIGTEDNIFDCDDVCSFGDVSNYFYIGAIEDTIVFDKWISEPTADSVGIPATFIVTEREEYLTMNNDCEYKTQDEIPWGTANVTCYDKDDNSSLKIDYDVYPIAGEKFKVCYQVHNYLSNEIDLEFYDFYMDNDVGESNIYYQEATEGYVPSIIEDKLYFSETPSRITELGGNLIDGYGVMCSKWFEVPVDVVGNNNWDIQGKVKINKEIYNLDVDVVWNWESDEFSIFGREIDKTYPDYLGINSFEFTHINATEGEYFQYVVNVTNKLPYTLSTVFAFDAKANVGGIEQEVILVDYTSNEQLKSEDEHNHLHTSIELPIGTTLYKSVKMKVLYGFIEEHEYDVIGGSLNIHVEDGGTPWTQAASIYPTIDIIAKDIEVLNITDTLAGLNGTACTLNSYTVFYNNIVSETDAYREHEQRFVLRGCLEDVTNDIYINCETLEAEPDTGTFQTSTFFAPLPFVGVYTQVGVDIWLYTYDRNNVDTECKHCGELIDFFNMEDGQEFGIIPDYSDACLYGSTLESQLDYRMIAALEEQNRLKELELGRWVIR